MVDDPKFLAYLGEARAYAAPPPSAAAIAVWKARLGGCSEQFRELALALQGAEAVKDVAKAAQVTALLKENYALRAKLAADLTAAKAVVDDNL